MIQLFAKSKTKECNKPIEFGLSFNKVGGTTAVLFEVVLEDGEVILM